jgi:hypothetical protein
MRLDRITIWSIIIIMQLILGIILSSIFLSVIWSKDDFWGDSYGSGILRFYGVLSLIFFVAVISVGIVGAIILRQTDKIFKAILFSVLFWFLALILYAVTFSFFSYSLNQRIIPLYIILIGIVVGFNFKIRPTPDV